MAETITLQELHDKTVDWLGRYPGTTPVRIALNDPEDAEEFALHPITRSWVYESPPDDDHHTTLHIVLAFPMPKVGSPRVMASGPDA